ncbi:hypothetical protein [Leptolyngbya ectocarpi]|nr:hypothetical protein [Leptolyngbya ectocarpi]
MSDIYLKGNVGFDLEGTVRLGSFLVITQDNQESVGWALPTIR